MANFNDCFLTIFRPYSKIVIILDSILSWEASYYPAITAGLVSVFFTLMCYVNMSIVSFFCISAIFVTFLDFALPIVNDIIAKDWSSTDETKYKTVCAKYSSALNDIVAFLGRFTELRKANIKLYYVILLSLLLTLAWIGTWLSDTFFLYVVTMFVLLYPGLCRLEPFQTHVCEKFNKLTAYLLPQHKADKKDK